MAHRAAASPHVVPPLRGKGVESVSSGAPPHRPRAYVAAPVAPENGLFQAINRSFDQAEDPARGDLSILVRDPDLVTRWSSPQRPKNRGVRISTTEQAGQARSFHGLVIAFFPDAAMLAAAEALPGVRAVIAVALHSDRLLEWVTVGAPQPLAVTPWRPGPRPQYWRRPDRLPPFSTAPEPPAGAPAVLWDHRLPTAGTPSWFVARTQ
jgi:hypothetical protein